MEKDTKEKFLKTICNNFLNLQDADNYFRFPSYDFLIEKITSLDQNKFEVKKLGRSVELRDIFGIKFGRGPIKIMAWTQMHGDEPTATRAVLDFFYFIQNHPEEFDELIKYISEKCTMLFVPMVNPDGAEHHTRENAWDIDLNRDALRLTAPESKILKMIFDDFQPEYSLNMHNQSKYYGCESTGEHVELSFLATAPDKERSLTVSRKRAISLINKIVEKIGSLENQHIPMGKYDDKFEPRAFGDNFQAENSGLVLIESGYVPGDENEEKLRKLNFLSILITCLYTDDLDYNEKDLQKYNELPSISEFYFDVIVRNATLERDGQQFIADLGIKRERVWQGKSKYYYFGFISELGDLSTLKGFDEIDATNCLIKPVNTYSQSVPNIEDVKSLNFKELHKKGIASVKLDRLSLTKESTSMPLNILPLHEDWSPEKLSPATFLIQDLISGETKFIIVNGVYFPVNP
ncbi:M14 family zinc carboxypeptidase [Mangrovivirga sp. M17]|uniref:M14 family zinc carboxypeptidase n=1 Tax=Mangrovivirga halotolerans TaxID=2993936 RepID=A0ABT3RK56_9BACT|nr:M14 family zinc carboxypeptidase [Mangrovivirga halotolerans]MCX2742232.1 M14 family zinc carboxypeptidase [Mangrovivirga halotolerans]